MKNIAVICTSLSAVAFRDCFEGIRECAIADNSNVFFFSCDRMAQSEGPYEAGEFNIFDSFDFLDFDGAILLCNTFVDGHKEQEIAKKMEEAGIPVVSIEGDYAGMYNFKIDNRRAMYEMVHHFIQDHGFKRISFVTGPMNSLEAKERYAGYIDAMQDYGIEFTDEQVYHGDFMPQSGRDAAEYFLNLDGPLPEAIVCSNDYMAMGINSVFRSRGIKVGEQVAISGFDNSLESKHVEPRLTSVSRENYKAGYAACSKLISGFDTQDLGCVKPLQTNVIRRESCGCVSREEYDEEKFRKKYYEGSDTQQFFSLETRRLFAEMSNVKTMSEFKQTLIPFIKHMKCEDFYLCLSNEWEGIHSAEFADDSLDKPGWKDDYISTGYGSNTFLAFSYASHAHKAHDAFGIKQLVEGLEDKNLGRNCFVILPIHFNDRMFGYCIASNCDFAFENPLFQTWIQNIGYALETVRKENLIKALSRKLDSLWIYDNLTGLYNRDGFNKYATSIWTECMKKQEEVTLFFVDLDELKIVNDKYGHDVGDRFVKAIASILKKRKHHGEAIMRFGGDEYVILASKLKEGEAEAYCDSIYEEVDDYNRMHNLPTKISVTIGYHQTIPTEESDLDLAIKAADAKRFEARREKEK